MCLEILKKFKPPVYGYKIFQVEENGKLYNIHAGNGKSYEIGKILDEKSYRNSYALSEKYLTDYDGEKYQIGFHIYQTKQAAKAKCDYMTYRNWKVYKVEIIEPLATGQEYGNDCKYKNVIVSKKMRIIEKV